MASFAEVWCQGGLGQPSAGVLQSGPKMEQKESMPRQGTLQAGQSPLCLSGVPHFSSGVEFGCEA